MSESVEALEGCAAVDSWPWTQNASTVESLNRGRNNSRDL